MTTFKRFLICLSGVDERVLLQCPLPDHGKYFRMGALVLLTGVSAFLSFSYAAYTVFEWPPIAALLGCIWGILIVTIDMLVLATYPKKAALRLKVVHASLRIFLGIMVGTVVAHPIILRFFDHEIQGQQHKEALNKVKILYAGYILQKNTAIGRKKDLVDPSKASGTLEFSRNRLENAEKSLERCDASFMKFQDDHSCELLGKGADCPVKGKYIGTGPNSDGYKSDYQSKQKDCVIRQNEIIQIRNEISKAETAVRDVEKSADDKIEDEIAGYTTDYGNERKAILEQKSSFFSKSIALSNYIEGLDLAGKNTAKLEYYGIILVFIFVEILPILTKINAQPDGADELADQLSKKFNKQIAERAASFTKRFDTPAQEVAYQDAARRGGYSSRDLKRKTDDPNRHDSGWAIDPFGKYELAYSLLTVMTFFYLSMTRNPDVWEIMKVIVPLGSAVFTAFRSLKSEKS